MAGYKKKQSKGKTRAKAASSAKKASPERKVAAKKKPATGKPRRAASPPVRRRAPKAFAERVRDRDAGTGVWFVVAGSVEHAVIQGRGNDGAVVIRTDAGVTEVVPAGNLFETADEARTARYR